MSEQASLVIRGGTVIDGSGGDLVEADVAVRDGTIAAVGKDLSKGDQEINAAGKLVTPGFVDVHTHYDAQVTWSNRITPSSWNGVTTLMMGNCGVGFAPCKPEQRDMLIELMEGVEDIPEVVLTEGLPWNWEQRTGCKWRKSLPPELRRGRLVSLPPVLSTTRRWRALIHQL